MDQPVAVSQRIPNPEPARRTGAHQSVQYDRGLIHKLTADHSLMLELFGEVIRQAESGQWGQAHAVLQKFRAELNGHLLLEGVKLYAYMSSRIDSDTETAEIFKAYKLEMGDIGKSVFAFFDQYRDASTLATREQQSIFLTTATSVANALADRISREESHLYPLYQEL